MCLDFSKYRFRRNKHHSAIGSGAWQDIFFRNVLNMFLNVLFLPEPTGMVAIDSKFPLEAYRRMTDVDASEFDRKAAGKQFKQDIQKRVQFSQNAS